MDQAVNPFSQARQNFQLHIETAAAHVPYIETIFEDQALSISSFEVDEATQQWRIDMLFDHDPTVLVTSKSQLLQSLHDITLEEVSIVPLHNKDWVGEAQKSFVPIRAGRFFVHGTHYDDSVPANAIPLILDAGAAFGTGEHQTTKGCLEAIDMLARMHQPKHLLDMGCGSGILAIAMAKIWHTSVLAVDIDEVSVSVAHENVKQNDVHYLVACRVSDGYRSPHVKGPYEVITANILAKPLISMASDLRKHLADHGYVILSGLLKKQEQMVLQAHKKHGLHLFKRIEHDEWPTLILKTV